jgi:hypothetical protein
MLMSRAIFALPMVVWLGGCDAFTPVPDPSLSEQTRLEKDHIYFPGHSPAQMQSAKRLGTASGLSCRTNLLGEAPTVEAALKKLWEQAAGKGATSVVNVACFETDVMAAYENSPMTNQGCWPGYICKGEAIK